MQDLMLSGSDCHDKCFIDSRTAWGVAIVARGGRAQKF